MHRACLTFWLGQVGDNVSLRSTTPSDRQPESSKISFRQRTQLDDSFDGYTFRSRESNKACPILAGLVMEAVAAVTYEFLSGD